jgi:hypothetical protein
MYEVMWDVNKFADKSLWPTDGSDPFVYSMNIGGSAAHGDYVFGWEGDSLQKAMDNQCNLNTACPKAGLTVQTPEVYNACKKKQQAPEEVDGCKFAPSLRILSLRCMLLTRKSQGSRRCLLARSPSRHKSPHPLVYLQDCPSSLPPRNWRKFSSSCCLSVVPSTPLLSSDCNNSIKIATVIYANCCLRLDVCATCFSLQ